MLVKINHQKEYFLDDSNSLMFQSRLKGDKANPSKSFGNVLAFDLVLVTRVVLPCKNVLNCSLVTYVLILMLYSNIIVIIIYVSNLLQNCKTWIERSQCHKDTSPLKYTV